MPYSLALTRSPVGLRMSVSSRTIFTLPMVKALRAVPVSVKYARDAPAMAMTPITAARAREITFFFSTSGHSFLIGAAGHCQLDVAPPQGL